MGRVEIGALHSKPAEVNGTKLKSLRFRRAESLTGSKRAEQGCKPYSALKVSYKRSWRRFCDR